MSLLGCTPNGIVDCIALIDTAESSFGCFGETALLLHEAGGKVRWRGGILARDRRVESDRRRVGFSVSPGCSIASGGFVGVDIFFVISGYLITGLLLRDLEGGRLSIFRFYQRRIARIAPAALFVVVATIAAGFFLYSAQDFASIGATALAATLSFINIKLLFQGSYFEISPDAQPLIHYWSLAVEEQFYLVFPVLIYFLMRMRRYALAAMITCLLLSLLACVFITPLAPAASFYLLPTRAWELLAGSSLALTKRQYPKLAAEYSSLYLTIGLVIISLSFFIVRSEGFPGWIATIPVAGSVLVLIAIGSGSRAGLHRALAHPTMVFVGKRSYSLYLWHWPTFSFVDYHFYKNSPLVGLGLKVVVSILATILTYRLVERPMRSWLNLPHHRLATFGLFAIVATVIGFAGYTIRSNYYLSAEARNVAAGGISVNPSGKRWLVVIGDSQGAMYGYELASLARVLGFRLNVLSAAAGNELPGDRDTLWPRVSEFLGDAKPDVIVLAQAWSEKLGADAEARFGDAIATMKDRAKQIIVVTQPPLSPPNATRHAMLEGARPPFFEDLENRKGRLQANTIIRKFEDERVRVIDVADIFIENGDSLRVVAPDGRLVYQDRTHLSSSGTALVRPRLEETLQSMINSTAGR
ncbi:acyltransferase [Bradyrhizobium diazoefficiens]|uniref:acyltransferase family protein n=1 Tax=Bradyrhizobium diazoefficiens TaxID=1355477 RepID=UPI00190BDB57|nr:acyltransferase family protein [Bradyrhizobium diazoefficiens]MBK3665344.1 acyltransferase [Bradyrhizobium diazoefficiens]